MLWPTVEGALTSVGLEKIRKAASNIGHGNNPKVTFYKPRISYSYEVQGARFIGNRVQFGMPKRESVKLRGEQAIRGFSVGQTVRVHYDPRTPKESVLETGVHPFWKKRLSFVLWMMALSGGGWMLATKLRQAFW